MNEGTRFCHHCDKPITAGQAFQTFAKVSISAGGITIRLHEKCAKRAQYVRRHP
ncbi:hypothetical protein OG302_22225 [Streptomyces sp. NBC_01283]|uniref:hypothetical protein n=1 Tax=Streptomyces sp. NBC_01283 TaxID=2903812 RepID=UPI00352DDDBF|nr:hypothetical protein OG302_22225 [Streptomyces sp. NBC_01283]